MGTDPNSALFQTQKRSFGISVDTYTENYIFCPLKNKKTSKVIFLTRSANLTATKGSVLHTILHLYFTAQIPAKQPHPIHFPTDLF